MLHLGGKFKNEEFRKKSSVYLLKKGRAISDPDYGIPKVV
jgi:hypothetical protein